MDLFGAKNNWNGKEVAACLVKSTIKKGRETVPTSEIIKALSINKVPGTKSKLIEYYEIENEQMNNKLIDQWWNWNYQHHLGFKAELSHKNGSDLWIGTAFYCSAAYQLPAQLSFKPCLSVALALRDYW